MLSLSRFDLIAALIFIVGCVLLFSIRYIGRGIQPTTHKKRKEHE